MGVKMTDNTANIRPIREYLKEEGLSVRDFLEMRARALSRTSTQQVGRAFLGELGDIWDLEETEGLLTKVQWEWLKDLAGGEYFPKCSLCGSRPRNLYVDEISPSKLACSNHFCKHSKEKVSLQEWRQKNLTESPKKD